MRAKRLSDSTPPGGAPAAKGKEKEKAKKWMKAVESLPRIPSGRSLGRGGSPSAVGEVFEGLPSLPRRTVEAPSSSQLPPFRSLPLVTENSVTVQTSKDIYQQSRSAPDSEALPAEWTQKQLEMAADVQRTKVQWENEIARHILSLYASSKAKKDMRESNSLLDFVGERAGGKRMEEEEHMNITTNIPSFDPYDEPDQNNDIAIENEYGLFENEDFDADNNVNSGQKAKKKMKKKKAVKKPTLPSSNNQSQQKKSLISEILAKINAYGNVSQEDSNPYRTTNTIIARNGQVITVRGLPRCFPIWFTSTGDIYANWTKLPGQRYLQAHLSSLYERGYYKEYLTILETVIIELFREKMYGKQEFKVDSFGISSYTQDYTRTNKSRKGSKGRENGGTDTQRTKNHSSSSNKEKYNNSSQRQQWIDQVLFDSLSSEVRAGINQGMEAQEGGEIESDLSIEEVVELFQQLIYTTLAIAILCIEKKHFELALTFINKAGAHSNNTELLTVVAYRKYFKAQVHSTMAYYFFKKKKMLASQEYVERAREVFEREGDYEGVGACLLHIGAILTNLTKFKEAHQVMYQFLAMVESGRLSSLSASPKQLCMVAVGYHNLAIVQLKLDASDLACKSSQNARKIARLCLSYSNRYIDTFQYTHKVAISDMKYDLSTRDCDEYSMEQLQVIKELSEALFAVDADILRQPDSGGQIAFNL